MKTYHRTLKTSLPSEFDENEPGVLVEYDFTPGHYSSPPNPMDDYAPCVEGIVVRLRDGVIERYLNPKSRDITDGLPESALKTIEAECLDAEETRAKERD